MIPALVFNESLPGNFPNKPAYDVEITHYSPIHTLHYVMSFFHLSLDEAAACLVWPRKFECKQPLSNQSWNLFTQVPLKLTNWNWKIKIGKVGFTNCALIILLNLFFSYFFYVHFTISIICMLKNILILLFCKESFQNHTCERGIIFKDEHPDFGQNPER